MEEKRVLLVGATGMVGGLALRLCLERPEVAAVTVLGRRALADPHPKLTEVLHGDFGDFGTVADTFAGQDAALYCLGAYTGVLPDPQFKRVTVDYTVAFAEALHRHSPAAAFCLLSGQGADQTERSRMAFARYKGAAEKAVLGLGFPRVHLFRPGYIYPRTKRREPNFGYRAMRVLYPVLRLVYPNIGIAADDLARVMVAAALGGTPDHPDPVLENRAIRALARQG